MATPNTAMQHAANRPFQQAVGYDKRSQYAAEALASEMREEGWEVKVTNRRLWRWSRGPGRRTKEWLGVEFNVWYRPAEEK